ncbi:MAG: TetR/AcrR family transcriptional regulator [Acidimicrobiales bacterium]
MTDTRQLLLDATRRCISAKGLASTTSRDITAEAAVNLAAITYHFGSKDQLVAEALLEELREWLTPAIEVLAGGGDPSARTLVAIQTLTATFAQHRDEAPAYLQALVEAPRLDPLRAGVVQLWSELRQLLGSHITDMQQRDELPAWVNPDAMSSLLVGVTNGLVLQVTVDPNGPDVEAMASQFGALLLAVRQPS